MHKINANKSIYILPNTLDHDKCLIEIHKILLSLDSTFKYNLEFCVCIHTNNSGKKFIPTYPGMSNIYDDSKYEYFVVYARIAESIKATFKFKGYVNILSNTLNFNEPDVDLSEYTYYLFYHVNNKIREFQKEFNMDSENNKHWVEYKRPLILIINKIK